MSEHTSLADGVPARMRDRPTWLISRAYARANGLLQEGFAQDGGGLRSYHYRLLAALDESGPASQAALGLRGAWVEPPVFAGEVPHARAEPAFMSASLRSGADRQDWSYSCTDH